MTGTAQKPEYCGKATDYAYPASPEGWMALCTFHGMHMMPHIFRIEEVINSGEKFEGALTGRILIARCECGTILSEEELRAGYKNAATGRPICEDCWTHACDSDCP